ncbi:MAG TPA: hypothetical protein VF472_12220 [Burkholderiaceae bacterium]
MKKLLLLAAALGLAACQSGCTTVTGSAYAGYESAARKGIEVANDNAIKTTMDAICAWPYGAILRNPQAIPVAKAACLPQSVNNAPETTLPAAIAAPASSAQKAQ